MLRYKSNDTITYFAKSTGEDNNVSISQVTSPGNGRKKVCIKYHNSTTSYGLTTDVTASQYSPKIKMNGSEYYFGKLNSSFLSTYTLTTTVTISNITNSTLNYTSISNTTYTVEDDWGHYNSDYCSSFTTTEKIKFDFAANEKIFTLYAYNSSTYNYDYITSTYNDYITNGLSTGIIRTFMDSRAYVISAADNKEDILYYVSEDVTCKLLNLRANPEDFKVLFNTSIDTVKRFFGVSSYTSYNTDYYETVTVNITNHTITKYNMSRSIGTSAARKPPLFVETTMSHSNLLYPRMIYVSNGIEYYFQRVLSNYLTYNTSDNIGGGRIIPELFLKYDGCCNYYNSLNCYSASNSSYSNSRIVNTYSNYMDVGNYDIAKYSSPIINTSFSFDASLFNYSGIDYITDFYTSIKISDIPEILNFSSSSYINGSSGTMSYYSDRTTVKLDCAIEYDITKSDFVITKHRNFYKTKTINEMTTGYTKTTCHSRYMGIRYTSYTANRFTNISTTYKTFTCHTITDIEKYECYINETFYDINTSSNIYTINSISSTISVIKNRSVSINRKHQDSCFYIGFYVDKTLSKITSLYTGNSSMYGPQPDSYTGIFHKKECVNYLTNYVTINESDFISLHNGTISYIATQPYVSKYTMYEETYSNIHPALQYLYGFSVVDEYKDKYNDFMTNEIASDIFVRSSLLVGTYSSYRNTKNITTFEDNYVTDKVLMFLCQRQGYNSNTYTSKTSSSQFNIGYQYRNIDKNITVNSNIFGLYEPSSNLLINGGYIKNANAEKTQSYYGSYRTISVYTNSAGGTIKIAYYKYSESLTGDYTSKGYETSINYDYNNDYVSKITNRDIVIASYPIMTITSVPYVSCYIDPNINV